MGAWTAVAAAVERLYISGMTMGTHPLLSGLFGGAVLLFNGAPRCVPTADLLLSISHLLDADQVDQEKPSSRVHCEEAKSLERKGRDVPSEPFSSDEDCRCIVVAVSVA